MVVFTFPALVFIEPNRSDRRAVQGWDAYRRQAGGRNVYLVNTRDVAGGQYLGLSRIPRPANTYPDPSTTFTRQFRNGTATRCTIVDPGPGEENSDEKWPIMWYAPPNMITVFTGDFLTAIRTESTQGSARIIDSIIRDLSHESGAMQEIRGLINSVDNMVGLDIHTFLLRQELIVSRHFH